MSDAPTFPPPPPPPRPSFWGRLFTAFLLLLGAASLALNFILLVAVGLMYGDFDDFVREKTFSGEATAVDKIAVISIDGVMLDGEGFYKRQIDRVSKDLAVKAVVLRVDSPGGSIAASDYVYYQLRKLTQQRKIPLVVSMGTIAASGGYYVAMAVGDAADTIFAEPSTWTGSIGVIIPHYTFSDLMAKVGVREDSIASEPLKHMGSFARPMTDEERKIFQSLVDEGFTQFKAVIKQGRPKFRKDPTALDRLATGQIYSATQAKNAGLVDRIGFLDDAIQRAAELAHLTPAHVRVVRYRREVDWVGGLFQSRAPSRGFDLAALFDAATPRAYYLYTALPALAGLGPGRP
jgi:protease-4